MAKYGTTTFFNLILELQYKVKNSYLCITCNCINNHHISKSSINIDYIVIILY